MFEKRITATVTDLIEHSQTHFQCLLSITAPLESAALIRPGMLVAAENIYHSAKEERYCILQVLSAFPAKQESKKKSAETIALQCRATPIGIELRIPGGKTKKQENEALIETADLLPAYDAAAYVLDDEMTGRIIHHRAPGSRASEEGRIDIGTYATNPEVNVGLDPVTLVRGNIAMISARPRARTTMMTNLVHALLKKEGMPIHIVYCDVNYQGTLSILPEVLETPNAQFLCLNDKFIPQSVFGMFKNPGDRQLFKRAVYDYLDMMILPSVLEQRRRDFLYPVAQLLRAGRLHVYRAGEPTVDEFVNDIRVDILDGVEEDVETLLAELMTGIGENFKGERFNEKNLRDILDLIEETAQETKVHGARRSLYDLKVELQSVSESFAKDIPSSTRVTLGDLVNRLNDDNRSSLTVVQGNKSTDILRFTGTLVNRLVEERLRRLKLRVPVMFIFSNADDYFSRAPLGMREAGSERFTDILNALLFHGRRHGLGFCISIEDSSALDKHLAQKIHSYFIGPLRFTDDMAQLENLLNVSGSLFQPAVNYEDGHCLFTSADSPYQRQVPLPFVMPTNLEVIHAFLDESAKKHEQFRAETQLSEPPRDLPFPPSPSAEPQGFRERADHPERPERPERSERPERPERSERPERPERSERPERPERSSRRDRGRDRRHRGKGQHRQFEGEPDTHPAERLEPDRPTEPPAPPQPRRAEPPAADATPLTFETRIRGGFDEEPAEHPEHPQEPERGDIRSEMEETHESAEGEAGKSGKRHHRQRRPAARGKRGGRRGKKGPEGETGGGEAPPPPGE